MRGAHGRVAVILLFVAMLAVLPVLNRRTVPGRTTHIEGPAAPRSRQGFRLREVSREVGIDFVHEGPTLDAKLGHIMPQVAAMGAGVSVCDYDRDGWHDLYVTNSAEGSRNRLYRNRGDGSFRDVAEALGVADVNRKGTGVSMGSTWGDFDNDGLEDLFLIKWGRPELFHNDGGNGFTRVTERAGLPRWVNAGAATWLDYDRDGFLDLFVAGYWDERLDLWHLETTRVMPESFEYAANGGRKYLLRNRGDGTFEDVTEAVGIDSRRWALCAAAADLRGTGYPDIFVANDYGVSELFANHGGKAFREVGRRTGIGFAPKSGMNVAFGDVFNRGLFAVYVTNISEEGVLIQGNNLWVPVEGTAGDGLRYENLAGPLGVELGGWSFGAQFGDLDDDGDLDLVLTNGYVSADLGTSYWYEFSQVAGGHGAIIADAANWPPMRGKSLSGYQPKRLWLNDGAGRFDEVAQAVGFDDTHDGRAVALVDLWNRGVLDIVVANQRGPLLVYRNTPRAGHAWVGFDLRGSRSNRGAVGARVVLHSNRMEQVQEVSGGSGYAAQNDRRLHFGLGPAPRIERAVIRWPSGREQTIEAPAPGRYHTVEEPR